MSLTRTVSLISSKCGLIKFQKTRKLQRTESRLQEKLNEEKKITFAPKVANLIKLMLSVGDRRGFILHLTSPTESNISNQILDCLITQIGVVHFNLFDYRVNAVVV